MLSKTAASAIVAMGVLAAHHSGPDASTGVTSAQVAERTRLSQPLAAKLLTTLSQHGLVRGVRGRHGGYTLARPPEQIRLRDIVSCFERADWLRGCPLGLGPCLRRRPCPLHASLSSVRRAFVELLETTTLEPFTRPSPEPAVPKLGRSR